jgi:ParG
VEAKDKSVKISFYAPDELRTRLKIACAVQQISMNQVLIDLVESWVKEHDPLKQQTPALVSTGTRARGKGEESKERAQ